MKLPAIAAAAAAFALLLPCQALAQEAPEAVYGKFHRAMKTGNFDEMKKYGSAESMGELARMAPDQRTGLLAFAAMLLPPEYTITGKQPSPDGNGLTLRATARIPTLPGAKPEQANGAIQMVKQNGAWKVHQSSWQNADPTIDAARPVAGAPAPAPKAAAAQSAPQRLPVPAKTATPKAPERKIVVAKEPCVYKPVMTNEDLARCR